MINSDIEQKGENKGNVPNLRFPGFEGEWESKRLGELLEFKNGINASKEQYGTGYKFINVLDILNNDYLTHEKIVGKVDVNQATVDKYPVNYGDILFQRSSETREEVGTANVYLDKNYTATFGGFVIRGRKIADYNPIFLNKLLKTNSIRNSITSRSGGSTRYNVGQEILSSTIVTLPPLLEQHKIATFLSLLDTRIETQNKIISHLESLIFCLTKKLLCLKLRFSDENGIEYPDWEAKRLKEILTIGSGRDYKHLAIGKVPVFGTGGLMTYVDKYLYKGETVCIGRKGTIDKPMYYDGEIWTVDTLFYTHSFVESEPRFIYHTFRTINWKEYNEASGLPSLAKSTIEKIQINTPSHNEQKKIANFLSSLDEKIEAEKKVLKHYEIQKKYLLNNLFI